MPTPSEILLNPSAYSKTTLVCVEEKGSPAIKFYFDIRYTGGERSKLAKGIRRYRLRCLNAGF